MAQINRKYSAAQHRQRGASLVEYALLLALIAVVALAGYRMFLDEVSENFSEISSALDNY